MRTSSRATTSSPMPTAPGTTPLPFPADHASFGPFDRLDELSKKRVRGIIEQAAAAHAAAGTPEQQIGDFYAAYMDEAAIEDQRARAGAGGSAAHRRGQHAARQWRALFGEPGFASLFDVQLPPDFKNPDRYSVFISESSLGLPDRDYYLKDDPQLKELRAKYVAYIAQMLTLGGVSDAAGQGARHHGLRDRGGEGAVADREAPRRGLPSTTRAPRRSCSPSRRASRGRRSSRPSSSATRAAAGARRAQRHPRSGRSCSATRRSTTLQAFLTFHYLSSHAPYLPQALRRGALRLLRPDDARPAAAARALEARGGCGRRCARRGGRAAVRRAVFPARIQGEDAAAGRRTCAPR